MSYAQTDLCTWLLDNGSRINPSVVLKYDVFGLSMFASSPVPPSESIISIPFELAVTPAMGETAMLALCGDAKQDPDWPSRIAALQERIKVAMYLVLHTIWSERQQKSDHLRHEPYVKSLPSASTMRTPLFFTAGERDLLRGTSVFGAAQELEAEWKSEWENLSELLQLDGLTWERYLLAATLVYSRAFPSRLLHLDASTSPNSDPATSSHPILLPGIDILNHLPSHPVSWISSPSHLPSTSAGMVTVQVHQPIPAGHEVFNNYGDKPSSELLLAYGFIICDLPTDTFPLKLGGVPPALAELLDRVGLDATERFELSRSGQVRGKLMGALRVLVADQAEQAVLEARLRAGKQGEEVWGVEIGGENELGALDVLEGMLESKMAGLSLNDQTVDADVREDVKIMCLDFQKGQYTILEAAMQWVAGEKSIVASRHGFNLEEDEEDEDEDENSTEADEDRNEDEGSDEESSISMS